MREWRLDHLLCVLCSDSTYLLCTWRAHHHPFLSSASYCCAESRSATLFFSDWLIYLQFADIFIMVAIIYFRKLGDGITFRL